MSNALALSGVTAVIQYCLNSVLNSPTSAFGSVSITAVAPDIVQTSIGGGASAGLQVNLFLHQVTPNAAWRNMDLPSLGSDGSNRMSDPFLALDLHYLLTAYASEDTMAEALLGTSLLMLHENPVLPRTLISTALSNVPATTNPLSTQLVSSGLAEQIEMIKITPATLGKEEMAWLWTALKADYRPTFPFQVSVVLIQRDLPLSFPLPVLSRNIVVQPGPPPELSSIDPPAQFAFAPGDTVRVLGVSLAKASRALLTNTRLDVSVQVALDQATNESVSFKIPDTPATLPAGQYSLSVQFTDALGAVVQSTNPLSLPVSPVILLPATITGNTSGTLVTVNCKPDVWPNQSASLALAGLSVPAQPFTSAASTLNFQFPTLTPGNYLARLRVDGADSPITVDWIASPPTFTGPMITVL